MSETLRLRAAGDVLERAMEVKDVAEAAVQEALRETARQAIELARLRFKVLLPNVDLPFNPDDPEINAGINQTFQSMSVSITLPVGEDIVDLTDDVTDPETGMRLSKFGKPEHGVEVSIRIPLLKVFGEKKKKVGKK